MERQIMQDMMLHFIDEKTNILDFKRSNKGNDYYTLNRFKLY